MIRALVILLGLAIGLAAAVITQGRISHWRALADPPAWTAVLAPDSGLLRGRAPGPGGYGLGWRLAGLDGRGPVWAVWIDGPGTRIDLDATLGRQGLHLHGARGSGALETPARAGQFAVTGGTGYVTAQGLIIDLDARATRLRRDGTGLPDGPANLNLFPGGWRLALGGGADTGTDLRALTGD